MDIESFAIGMKVGAKGGGGSASGVLVVHVDWDVGDGTLDKTWQEIHDAALGQVLILPSEYGGTLEVYYLQKVIIGPGMEYFVDFALNSNGSVDWMHFSASSASDYPVWYE